MNSLLSDVKAVIFDMDGTILDSEPLHARAIQEVFSRYDIHMRPEEIMNRYIGWGDDNVYKDKKGLHSKLSKDEFITQKDELLLETISEYKLDKFRNIFAEGYLKFLDLLLENNIKCAVVSASARITVDSILKKAEIFEKFNYTLTRDEVYETKPSPACYLEAMRKLGVKTRETIIFEDSDHGLKSAVGSGTKVFALDLSLNDKFALKHIDNQELPTRGNYSWLL